MRAVVRSAVAGMLVLALAGCGAAPSFPGGPAPAVSSSGRFTGPWADLFDLTYAQSTSDDERAALDDEVVSAEEYAYFQAEILQCLDGLGVSGSFTADGGLDYSKPKDVTDDDIRRCNVDNGIRVLALHDAVERNPEHLDETTIMLECLRRTGVVGDAYTASDLENGVDLDSLGDSPDFGGCAADPLNYRAG